MGGRHVNNSRSDRRGLQFSDREAFGIYLTSLNVKAGGFENPSRSLITRIFDICGISGVSEKSGYQVKSLLRAGEDRDPAATAIDASCKSDVFGNRAPER
jgi:hypothetical protein